MDSPSQVAVEGFLLVEIKSREQSRLTGACTNVKYELGILSSDVPIFENIAHIYSDKQKVFYNKQYLHTFLFVSI